MPVINNTATRRYAYGLGTTVHGACRFDRTTADDAARDINGGATLVATVLQYSASRFVVMVSGVMTDRAFYVDAVTSRDGAPYGKGGELY